MCHKYLQKQAGWPGCQDQSSKTPLRVIQKTVKYGQLMSQQDACSGVHSACREENRRKVGIYVQLLRQGT